MPAMRARSERAADQPAHARVERRVVEHEARRVVLVERRVAELGRNSTVLSELNAAGRGRLRRLVVARQETGAVRHQRCTGSCSRNACVAGVRVVAEVGRQAPKLKLRATSAAKASPSAAPDLCGGMPRPAPSCRTSARRRRAARCRPPPSSRECRDRRGSSRRALSRRRRGRCRRNATDPARR